MVDWLASTFVLAEPTIMLPAKFDMVRVPAPLRVTLEAPMTNSVVLPMEFSEIEPALLMVAPLTVKLSALLMARVSLEPKVRVLVAPAMLRVTVEPAVLMQVFELLVGMPPFQLPATFQLPDPPPCQVEVHCASAVSGEKSTARIAIKRIRGSKFLGDESVPWARDSFRMSVPPEIVVAVLVAREIKIG